MKSEGGSDLNTSSEVDKEIETLKAKIKEIEDKLRELRSRGSPFPVVSSKRIPDDNSGLLGDLAERLEKLESSHEKSVEKINDHEVRIEKLESDNETNKDKISLNKQDIGELKDTMPEKVDCDTFDYEINYLKELFNQLGTDKKIDFQIPPPKPGMSTKDANKMKEMMAKIPELEKALKEILERLARAERGLEGHDKNLKEHDKQIEQIWEELAKKASAADLKDLMDRLKQVESDLERIIQHLNSIDKGSGIALPQLGGDASDKRLKALEKKLEDLWNHLSNSLRDINKTIDSLNNEFKGVKKDIEDQKNDLLKFMKKVNDIELKLEALLKAGLPSGGTTVQMSTKDNEKLEELKKALNDLRNDYRGFKSEVLDKFNQVDRALDTKASKEDLENLKNLLKNRLDELEKALNKTKGDLKRALKILNDKVKT